MLILSRRAGEVIHIGDSIKLTILSAHSESGKLQVRVGIDAPKEVVILREEVKQRNEQSEQVHKLTAASDNVLGARAKAPRSLPEKVKGKVLRQGVRKDAKVVEEKGGGLDASKGVSGQSSEVLRDAPKGKKAEDDRAASSLLDATFETTRQALDKLATKAK